MLTVGCQCTCSVLQCAMTSHIYMYGSEREDHTTCWISYPVQSLMCASRQFLALVQNGSTRGGKLTKGKERRVESRDIQRMTTRSDANGWMRKKQRQEIVRISGIWNDLEASYHGTYTHMTTYFDMNSAPMLNCVMVRNLMFQLMQVVVLDLMKFMKKAGFSGTKVHSVAIFSVETNH